MASTERVRILVAKPGLDGHDRGAKIVARALRDGGFDAVGLSIMSGAHLTLFPAVRAALDAAGAGDVRVFGGGIIPREDAALLEAQGVAKVFFPGARIDEIVDWVRVNVKPRPIG
jgi:methylmalonyl-CoA mutase C-terminal domain/subunit